MNSPQTILPPTDQATSPRPTYNDETIAIAIVGAGIGGLAAAIRLAAAGRRVAIYEQNATVGGKMSQIIQDGFRWDTGPSVITMRPVFEELFAAAGRRLDDYLTLLPVNPLTRYFYRDGTVLDATGPPSKNTGGNATGIAARSSRARASWRPSWAVCSPPTTPSSSDTLPRPARRRIEPCWI